MRRFVIITLFLLIIVGNTSENVFVDPKEHRALSKADAIVLLAGGYEERAPAAAQLYHAGYAPMILLTNDGVLGGWSAKYGRNLYQIEWAEEELVKSGVPRERIVKLPFHGSSTMHDALEVKRYALDHGLKEIIIVTSDYHMRRALWAFRKVFSGTPVDFSAYPAKSNSIGVWGRTVERVKFFYYLIRYGVLGLKPALDEQHAAGNGGKL